METPLSPLEFARRTRRLHGDRAAVVDGALRLTYTQFFDRCDRWSSALQGLGVAPGDRVATISPNTHAQLECFYSVPQLGAVLVPINYRLTPEDFVYIVNQLRRHGGLRRRGITGTPSWCSATAAAPPRRTSSGSRERLAHFKAPRGVTFVGELPKTATGKIQKFVLRKGAPNLARQ